MNYRPLLFINEYPPSSTAGAPVIARQLLRYYDTEKLDLVCCESWRGGDGDKVTATYLPCRHHWVPSYKRPSLRPRRVFVPIEATLDSYRIGRIMSVGRKIIAERGVRALFTMPYGCEFTLAAYLLHKETGLPLYVFETDYLPATARSARTRWLINRHYGGMLRSARKVWMTSPAMVRFLEREYDIEGEFLFHFVDVGQYQRVAREAAPLPADRIVIAYTGSINTMFWETMKFFCDLLNAGLTVDGRPVEMVIYSAVSPDPALLGPGVRWGGWVPLEQIPARLAEAHLSTILVSFSETGNTRQLVETSLYTKTVDYLAAGRPVLVVSPPYSAEVDYFGGMTAVVTELDKGKIVSALRRLVDDREYADGLVARGLDLVRERHSLEALDAIFLRHFREGEAASTVNASAEVAVVV
jgi:glycosyltransferase involved in cell wall biosynthesis